MDYTAFRRELRRDKKIYWPLMLFELAALALAIVLSIETLAEDTSFSELGYAIVMVSCLPGIIILLYEWGKESSGCLMVLIVAVLALISHFAFFIWLVAFLGTVGKLKKIYQNEKSLNIQEN